MAVTKNDLIEMLEKSIDADLAADCASAEQECPAFSEGFEQRMNDFFAKERSERKKNGARPRRWLIIAIAAAVALAATACAVPRIRESIAGFFVKIFSDHVEYTDPAITKDSIEEEYGLVPIPEGFTISDFKVEGTELRVIYTDDGNNTLKLLQSANKHLSQNVNSEWGSFSERRIGEKTIRICYSDKGAQASWIENGYFFSLTYPSQVDFDVFVEWVASVKVDE
ncbi:MAG: DUF4367 domain-containing protein [Clostridia bacterium]|nr:DUF4367 domain-containing protein [Clostridia bacterium]